MHELHHGNCLDILRTMPDCSVDAVVTDPPYGLSFMAKKWDYDVPSTEIWAECLRVLKPGGYLLAFAGTRTQHRMAVRIEDAGFEIRDMLAWMYGSGFPKSHNLDGEHQGWGTALKPAMEPITMARKPFKATVAQNVQEWGTGAINIDGCRIELTGEEDLTEIHKSNKSTFSANAKDWTTTKYKHEGRWPANVMHDGSAEILQGMGEAARFFYTPKACKDDRDDGCEMMDAKQYSHDGREARNETAYQRNDSQARNFHPTVKPTDLMRYLCRMVTPTGGIVLDPFTGSGSTGRGAVLEGFRFIGCEMDADYIEIAKARILAAEKAYQPCLTFD
jgi:site-specific DNA-methyltransferase (adenine-specific)